MRSIVFRLLLCAILGVPAVRAQAPVVIKEPNLALVQQPPPTVQPPPIAPPNLDVNQPPTNEPLSPGDLRGQYSGTANASDKASGAPTQTDPTAGAPTNSRTTDAAPAGATTSSVTGAGGAAGAAINAPDVSDLLSKSTATTGLDIQRRNPIVADLHLRGLRSTQYNAYADGGYFIPSRLDLDSVVSRFDPGTVRDVIVIKGPYSALYGPGFAFLDIATIDAPRYDCFQTHGRTAIGYGTNGARWDGVQSILVGDRDWGFRATYNILQGNDYLDGAGNRIASSYLSNTVNYALGVDLTNVSKLEFKGFHVFQQDLEFPGYYFDIRDLHADSLSLKYTLIDQYWFDKLTLDVWYNDTTATGNTQLGPKQAFVDRLLQVSFTNNRQGANGVVNTFQDFSDTNFAGRSIGYRLAGSWGPKDAPLLTLGTDLNVFGQGLTENILFQQLSGVNINTGTNIPAGGPFPFFNQQQSIPQSQAVDAGLFLQTEYKLTDDLKLRAGGRYDHVHAQSNPRFITGNIDLFGPPTNFNPTNRFALDPIVYSADPANQQLSRDFNLGSGFITSEYKATDRITGSLAFGYAQRAPTLTELYASGPFIGVLQQGTSRLIGDPNLKAEQLFQVDLGLRADFETWQAGVNGFYSWINNYITYDANRLGQGLTQVVYTNTDRATLAGAELFGQFNATSWLTPFGTLSYVQGIDQTPLDHRRSVFLASSRRDDALLGIRKPQSEALPQIPPLESRLGLRFHESGNNPRWQVELSARLVSAQNNVAYSLGELPSSGFTVFDVRTFWRVSDNWLVSFGCENVGDRLYREHLDPVSGNLIGVDPMFRPGTNFYLASQLTY